MAHSLTIPLCKIRHLNRCYRKKLKLQGSQLKHSLARPRSLRPLKLVEITLLISTIFLQTSLITPCTKTRFSSSLTRRYRLSRIYKLSLKLLLLESLKVLLSKILFLPLRSLLGARRILHPPYVLFSSSSVSLEVLQAQASYWLPLPCSSTDIEVSSDIDTPKVNCLI